MGWYRHGKYYFSPAGESFGKKILDSTVSKKADLVIIDEVGPVELKGKGWANEIENLVTQKSVLQLWVVRNHLLKRVFRQWKIGDILIVDVGSDTVEEAIEAIKEFIETHKKKIIL